MLVASTTNKVFSGGKERSTHHRIPELEFLGELGGEWKQSPCFKPRMNCLPTAKQWEGRSLTRSW
jgi:hypothetical protein